MPLFLGSEFKQKKWPPQMGLKASEWLLFGHFHSLSNCKFWRFFWVRCAWKGVYSLNSSQNKEVGLVTLQALRPINHDPTALTNWAMGPRLVKRQFYSPLKDLWFEMDTNLYTKAFNSIPKARFWAPIAKCRFIVVIIFCHDHSLTFVGCQR